MAGNNTASDGRSSCGLPWWQGGGQAMWHPFCHRQVRADPHRRGTGSCHISSQQDGVCNVHRATTLQPAPTVSFTFHLEHCCHALFYLLANLNMAMSAVPGASWMSGLRQMPMPVWIDEVFCKPLCFSEKLFPKCYCKDSGDENNDEKDDPIAFFLDILIQNSCRVKKILQLPVCGDKFHTSLFQDRSLLQALASLLCAQGTKYRSTLQSVLLCLLPVPRCKWGKHRAALKMGIKVS